MAKVKYINIITAAEQWKAHLEDFLNSGEDYVIIESYSYFDQHTLVMTARRYIEKFNLPIRVKVLWKKVYLERI